MFLADEGANGSLVLPPLLRAGANGSAALEAESLLPLPAGANGSLLLALFWFLGAADRLENGSSFGALFCELEEASANGSLFVLPIALFCACEGCDEEKGSPNGSTEFFDVDEDLFWLNGSLPCCGEAKGSTEFFDVEEDFGWLNGSLFASALWAAVLNGF